MRACASVLHATLDTLSADTSSDERTEKASEGGPAACAVRFDPLTREQKDKQATWCHACVLDASDGLWTMASTLEGDDWVIMGMKGSLSKHSNLLERMCFYRMHLPQSLFDGSNDLAMQLKCQLMPKLRADDLSMQERTAKIMVRLQADSIVRSCLFVSPSPGRSCAVRPQLHAKGHRISSRIVRNITRSIQQ